MVEKLASLCILDLTNNQIQDDGLPLSLSRLPHLRAIGLKENCLTRVPRVLGYVNSLQEIYLEENTKLEVRLKPQCLDINVPLQPLICIPEDVKQGCQTRQASCQHMP